MREQWTRALPIGYRRVSTAEQAFDLQREASARAGCERVFDDVCSGAGTNGPGLSGALGHARSRASLAAGERDRVGRSLRRVVRLVSGWRDNGVGLTRPTGGIDTASSAGRLVPLISATVDGEGPPKPRALAIPAPSQKATAGSRIAGALAA